VAYPPSIFSDPFDRSDEEKQIGQPGEIGQPAKPTLAKPSIFSDPDDHANLERAITTGQQTGPDEAARVLKLRLKTGLPADVIKRNVDTIERETQRQDFDAETFRRESPYLANWLTSDAYHAALTKDDLPALSAMEKALRMGATIGRTAVGGAIGVLRGTAGTVQAGAELADAIRTGAANLGRALPLPVQPSALTTFARESTEGGRQLGERFAPPADAGFLASAAYGGVESAGQMLPSLLIGLISPAAAMVTFGTTTGGLAYSEARGQGASVARSASYASLQGFIEVATEWIPAHKLFKDLGARAGLIPTLAHQLKSELIGEEVATAFQDANDWANLPANKDRTIGDYWRERPSAALATVIGTVVAVGATTTAAHATARTLEKLGDAVTDSKTQKRIPEKVTEFAEHVAEGEHFYADADVWGEYWQSKGVDPAVMATQLTGRSDAYAQALTTGQPIAIPRSAYASQLAATEHNGFFTKELRGAPDEFNEREAVEFDKAAGEETVEPQPSPVLTSILDQLLKAGEPAITAAPQAQLHEAVWANLAERAGIPVEALFEPYGVTVERQTGTGQAQRPASARLPLTAVPLTGQTPSRAEGQTGAAEGGPRSADVTGEQPAADAGRAQQAGSDVARADRRGLSATARPVPSELGEIFDRRPLAENQARLTPEVRRELEHMLVEMDYFPFVPRTFTPVEGKAGQGGNAGDYEIRGNVPQAGVYKDVQAFAPVNTFRGKPAKQARGTGGDIIAAVRAVLADGDVPNNLAEGALRVAEARTINDFSNLSPLELPREWADVAPTELVDALSDAIDDALDAALKTDGSFDDAFDIDEFSQSYADKGPSLFDELPTGEQQPRLPGAEGVREQEIATPQFEAPFSLTSEVAKPQAGAQTGLFDEFGQPLFHGSPHDFERFSLEHVGTGEGAQAYGHGLYFAENPKVAEEYQKRLSGGSVLSVVVDGETRQIDTTYGADLALLHMAQGNTGKQATAAIERGFSKEYSDDYKRALKEFDGRVGPANQGRLYQVDIPDEQIAKMLDWDAPLSEQPANVQKAVAELLGKPVVVDKGARKTGDRYIIKLGERVMGGSNTAEQAQANADEILSTGEQIYRALAFTLGKPGAFPEIIVANQQNASEALKAAGVPGLRYFDGQSRNIGEGTRNVVVFDDSIVTLTHKDGTPFTPKERDEFFQGEKTPQRRGAIRFGPGRKATISLFEGKDLSTFLHESGHLFVEVLGDLSARLNERDPETLTADQRQLLADYQTLLDWSGYGTPEGKAAAQAASKALRETIGTREATAEEQARLTELAAPHERLADGFLVYLREGKAPTVALQPVFARFRAWLVNLGKSLLGMKVSLTPEVRAVFSRLIASDTAIEEAEARRGAQGIFLTAEQAGMTEPEFGLYRARIEKASEQARARLDRKLTEDVQREQTRSWQAQRAEVEEQVAAEFYEKPEYRALAAMQRGTHPNGQSLMPEGLDSPPLKLSKTMLVERYGAERLKTLPRPYIYTREGGLNPDVLAEQFGYASGDAMLAAVEQAPPMRAAIQEETDRRMLREHGALILDGGALLEQAQTAIASEDHEAIVREELRALNQLRRTVKPFVQAERKAGRQAGAAIRGAIPSQKALNQIATDRIAAVRIGQLRPDLYWAASRRAHGKAVELAAKQDVEGAIAAQQQDLLNLALYREAERVKAWLDDTASTWRQRLGRSDASLAATRQMDYIAAARALADPLLRDEPNEKVADAIAAVKRYDPQMGDLLDGYLEAATQGVPLAQRTVEDARLTYEVIDALWETSKREQQIEIDGQLEQRATARAALTDRLDEIGTGRFAGVGVTGLPSRVERMDRLAVTIKAWHRRVESWTTAMDGGPDGPFRRYLWNPVKLAIDAFRIQKVATLKAYQAILEPIQDTLTPAKLDAPRLNGYVFGKDGSGGRAELLGALLHSGNRLAPTSNLAKLVIGRGWGAYRADGTLDASRWDETIREFQANGTLTKADYDFAQGIWDLFESIKPELQKAHRALYGFYFEEVTADPIETPWGTYRGGYVPAIADPLMSKVAEARYEQQMSFETGTSYSLPTVGRRSTIARKQVFEPLAMNLAFIPQHLDWALRFIHIQPAVRDASRLLTDRSLTLALNAHDPAAKSDMLMPWLMRAATQRLNEKGKSQAFDNFMTAVRTRTGMQALGFHVTNALQQTTGVLVGAVKIKRKHLLVSAAWDHLRAPSATGEAIRAESPFMETFLTSQAIEILQQLDNLILNPSVYGKSAAFLRQHAQFLASGSQNIVNHIVYLAARNDAEQDGLPREQAIRRAESAVRETQGSYFAEDVARVEADTPFMRSLKMFNGYFNMLGNLQTTEGGNAWRSDRGLTARVARIGAVYTLGFLLPSAISQVMMNVMRGVGPWDDDEDDTHIDEILNLFLGSPARTALSMVPIFGQIGQAAYGAVFTSQSYDDDIRISPTAGLIGSGIKDLAGHGSTKQTTKDFLSILGLLTNLPLGPLGRPIGYLLDVEAGKTRPTNALEFARGLVTGATPPRNRRGR
jgi:hypothetical protein